MEKSKYLIKKPFNGRLSIFFTIILVLTIDIIRNGENYKIEDPTIWHILPFLFFMLLINFIVIRDIKDILLNSHTVEDAIQKLIMIIFYGIFNIFIFAILYYSFGVTNSGNHVYIDFMTSMYFSIVTWTTLGYGDFGPIEYLRLFAAVEALMGYIYMAIMIGLFFSIFKTKVI
jgi:hypothetical protein